MRVLKINPQQPEKEKINIAAGVLRKGGLVIIPTETVYGVAADIRNQQAINQLCRIKQRPVNKPFSLHVDNKESIEAFSAYQGQLAFKLIDRFWPGALTLILPGKEPGSAIGMRMPDNNIALELISMVGAPLACPSANTSGSPPPVDFDEAIRYLGDMVDIVIDGGRASLGIESTVVNLMKNPYQIQREGALSREKIQAVAERKVVLFVCTGNSCRSVMAQAYFKKRLEEKNRTDIDVLSAGTLAAYGLDNPGASPQTKEVLEREGISVEGHRPQKITKIMIKKSDVILVMETMHEQRILEMVPYVKSRLFLLKEFAKIEDGSLDIQDPIGGSVEFHERIFSTIKQAIDRALEIL